jgi:hypothetical protein
MNIDESEYWKPHVTNSPALLVPKISKAVAARKKIYYCFLQLTYHLKYFLMELPLMLYLLIPQSSIKILSMEFRI